MVAMSVRNFVKLSRPKERCMFISENDRFLIIYPSLVNVLFCNKLVITFCLVYLSEPYQFDYKNAGII